MSFAQWVKDTRERQKLSIVECATRVGVSHPTWIEYENTSKTKQPRRETVNKIADALGVSPMEAMEAAGYQYPAVDIPAEWARLWTSTFSSAQVYTFPPGASTCAKVDVPSSVYPTNVPGIRVPRWVIR